MMQHNHKFPLTFIGLLLAIFTFAQNTGTLSGYVRDAKTSEPLIGATVQLDGTELGTVTDIDGFYEITDIPTKSYAITASYLGYEPRTEFNVIIKSAGTPELNFNLTEAIEALNEVVVKATRIEDIITPLSSQTLSAVEIATYPGGNNDIAKVVQSLPGVGGSIGGFRNDVIIRGGAPNENVYYLDGVEIPNINHFATQGSAGGPVGLLNVSFIETVDLATSAFNARYDNPLSGVLQFNQRVGNTREGRANLRVSASEAALTGEGPLFRKGDGPAKTSFIGSVRRSYLQFLFQVIGLPILPDYWDYQYKITHRIDDYNDINILGIGSIDDFSISVPDDYDPEQQATLEQVPIIKQRTNTAGISWKNRFRDGTGSMLTTLSINQLENDFTRYADNVEQTDPYFTNDSKETEIKLRYELTRYLGDWILTGGLGVQRAIYENNTTNLVDDISYGTDIDFWKYGLFAQASRSLLGNRLDVSFGLRTDANSFTTQDNQLLKTLSPRFSFSYGLNPSKTWRLNGSVGRYFKIPVYTVLGFRNNAGTLINQDAEYIRNDHFVAGIEHRLSESTRITVEGFYKKYANYPVSVLDGISLANKGGGFEVLGNEEVVSDGEGRTYGLEFLFQRQFTKRWYAILAYTLFWSEFSDLSGNFRPSAWDSRQLITFTGGYKFGNNWEVSLRYRFAGKTPFAPVDEAATLENYPAIILDFDRLGDVRLNTFNLADIRIDKKWNFKKVALDVFLELQNAFASQTPQPPQFGLNRDEAGNLILPRELVEIPQEGGSVIPVLGFVLDF
ncbi:MAG: TonB-dependent receptor [Saprospiraceae bacterium]